MNPCPRCAGQGCVDCAGVGIMSLHRRLRLYGPMCRACGCHELLACAEGCGWVEPDLCSSCA